MKKIEMQQTIVSEHLKAELISEVSRISREIVYSCKNVGDP